MKIKCEYCNGMFDDTLEKCPSCGAPNANVRRSTPDQPTTIEGLKEWYESKGLPPYETTRFFIGINYQQPRAFGIYKDENTGNFIVYKNKDDGSRAVRYEGSDEAYAVNELHTRLKQEILQQKSHNLAKNQSQFEKATFKNVRRRRKRVRTSSSLTIALILIVISGLIWRVTEFNVRPSQTGYYMCNDEEYYKGKLFYHYGQDKNDWAVFDTEEGDWKKTSTVPGEKLNYQKKAKNYYLSSGYDSSYAAYDFMQSQVYDDYLHDFKIEQGYFEYDGDTYYHMKPEQEAGWYVYNDDDGDWDYVMYTQIPSELKHQSVAQDFWYTPDWNSETQITDFTDTEDYQEYQEYLAEKQREEQEKASSSSSSSSSDSSYDWDSSSSWDSGSTDWGSDW